MVPKRDKRSCARSLLSRVPSEPSTDEPIHAEAITWTGLVTMQAGASND
jgi:hypothetical protein